jgi:hypothetical protein
MNDNAPIAAADPVPVAIVSIPQDIPTRLSPAGMQAQATDPSIPAKTTFQQDLTMAGQRRVNLIWEYTQAVVAVTVVLSNMIVGVYEGLVPSASHEYPVILSSALFLVIGFYFSRTNHAAIGGVGAKPQSEYTGR